MSNPMRKAQSDFSGRKNHHGAITSPVFFRQDSEYKAAVSHELLSGIEAVDIAKARELLEKRPEDMHDALVYPSTFAEHNFRTPLMAAAATGKFALFRTVLHAFEDCFSLYEEEERQHAMKDQLELKDDEGMTLVMIAARSGNVPTLRVVLEETKKAKVPYVLLEKDYERKTVLMHAAGAGNSAMFVELFRTMEEVMTPEALPEQLMATSGDNKTILMHTARCGDKMGLVAVQATLRKILEPKLIRELLNATDSDGVTFLMHAASSAKCRRKDETSSSSLQRQEKQQKPLQSAAVSEKTSKTAQRSTGAGSHKQPMTTKVTATTRGVKGTLSSSTDINPGGGLARNGDGSSRIVSPTEGVASAAATAAAIGRRSNKVAPLSTVGHDVDSTLLGESEDDEHGEASDGLGELRISSRAGEGAGGAVGSVNVSKGSSGSTKNGGNNNSAVGTTNGGDAVGGGGGDADDDHRIDSENSENLDLSVVIFKTAFNFTKEFLWKEQVRDQLMVKDWWGRTVLTHAVESERTRVFETVFYAVKGQILDFEVDQLLDIDKDDDDESSMEKAISLSKRGMRDLVTKTHQKLKKSVSVREKASSVQAKIESFVPGKLIVIFQLILPELKTASDDPLYLLIVLCAVAPFLSWLGNLISRETPSTQDKSRRSLMSSVLAAPAMFFWGIGTSTVGEESFGWKDNTSSVALAVATIVIPAFDSIFASQSVGRWYDKYCRGLLFMLLSIDWIGCTTIFGIFGTTPRWKAGRKWERQKQKIDDAKNKCTQTFKDGVCFEADKFMPSDTSQPSRWHHNHRRRHQQQQQQHEQQRPPVPVPRPVSQPGNEQPVTGVLDQEEKMALSIERSQV